MLHTVYENKDEEFEICDQPIELLFEYKQY